MSTGTVFPVAQGHPDMSGNLIPTIYSKKLQAKFYDATVLAQISNTDYEGEIKQAGDQVVIRTVPDITINTYYKGMTLTYETPTTSTVTLKIDQGHYWAFKVNTVDKAQSDIDFVNKWATDASTQLKIAVDTAVLAAIYDDAATGNYGASAGVNTSNIDLGTSGAAESITSDNAIDYVVKCGEVLDQQNVPEDGRWMVVPPWYITRVKLSDLKDASLTGDGKSVLRSGRIGMIDRMTLYVSNNVATSSDSGTKYNIPFGHKSALTFAAQVTDTETLTNQNDFGKLMRGLLVYGFKAVQPKGLGWLYAVPA